MEQTFQPAEKLILPQTPIIQTSPTQANNNEPGPDKEVTVEDILEEAGAQARPSADTKVDEQGNTVAAPAAEPTKPELTKEAAKGKLQSLMAMRDIAQSNIMAFAAGDMSKAHDFRMEKWEHEMLLEVYGNYATTLGKIPDWLYIILAEVTILGRRGYMAYDLRQEKKKNEKLKAQMEQMRLKLAKMEGVNEGKKTAIPLRPDFKKYWEIELQEGLPYFVNDSNGRYKAKDKRELAEVNDNTLPYLIKHNPKDIIDQLKNGQ